MFLMPTLPPRERDNDGTSPDLSSMSYTKMDDAVQGIWQSAVGSMLAKIDITTAHRTVPVHLVDRHLLVTAWRGKLFIDGALLLASGQLRKYLQSYPMPSSSMVPLALPR